MDSSLEPPRDLYPWEVRALKTAHRRVPLGEGGGYCRWCDKPILGKRGKFIGVSDPSRSWCREPGGGSPCLREWNLHRDSATQFNWLEEHRGLKCVGCRAVNPTREIDRHGWGQIEIVSDLEVDHVIPLWLVAIIIPEAERRPYFGPDNLQLLCSVCHKAKTKREAGERAQMRAFERAQLVLL